MAKKFICTVCGYIHEGDEAPKSVPFAKLPAINLKKLMTKKSSNL